MIKAIKVDFSYCNLCIHGEKNCTEQPCKDCLTIEYCSDSNKPAAFADKEVQR